MRHRLHHDPHSLDASLFIKSIYDWSSKSRHDPPKQMPYTMIERMREMGISMKPKLDYLMQYPVEKVETSENGYVIVFSEGGATVEVEGDFKKTDLPDIVGKAFVTQILGSESVRMVFGDESRGQIVNATEIEFPAESYSILDNRFEGGEKHYPGRFVAETQRSLTIREQFNKRFADGPGDPQTGDEPLSQRIDAPDDDDA
jgi:hypothetical protein